MRLAKSASPRIMSRTCHGDAAVEHQRTFATGYFLGSDIGRLEDGVDNIVMRTTIKSARARARPDPSPRGFARPKGNHESPGPPLQAQCHRLFRLGCVAPEALHAPGAWGACLQLLSRRTPNMRNTSRNARLHDCGRTSKENADDTFARAI
jgi:hypothetical protein